MKTIRDQTEELQKAISKLLNDFEKETGMQTRSVEVDRRPYACGHSHWVGVHLAKGESHAS